MRVLEEAQNSEITSASIKMGKKWYGRIYLLEPIGAYNVMVGEI